MRVAVVMILLLGPLLGTPATAAPPPLPLFPARSQGGVVLPSLRPAPLPVPELPALRAPGVAPGGADPGVAAEAADLRAALRREVPDARLWPAATAPALLLRARAALGASLEALERPQTLLVVDRNPAVQRIAVVLARLDGPWEVLGAGRISTGQGGRKDYYFTPTGVFAHTDAILDFRAEGTYNENNIRGLGVAGMRVWDFGWQWSVKGWRSDGEGGDIRLQMHATDPDALEQRLGRPASEGCVRVSSAMNRFLDRHGILDLDYERAAVTDASYRALLRADRVPTPLGGRLLIVVDSREPVGAPPTGASRPSAVMAGSN